MRFDSVPNLNNSTSLQKTEEISLDLSSRSKIVIRPLLQRPTPSSTAAKAVIPGPSIFSSKSIRNATVRGPAAEAKLIASPKSVLKSSRSSSHSTTSPRRDRTSGPARVEKLEKVEVAKAHATVEKRVRIVEPPKPPKPVVVPLPRSVASCAAAYLPYAEECAKCGCTSNGQPPCQRCQLMLLADKFCDLVYKQCEKWNIQI